MWEGIPLQKNSTFAIVKDILRRPEYRRIKIGLERLNRILSLIEGSWRSTSRHHALMELENMLDRQHEIEREAENIKDVFMRGYIHEQLDNIAALRRSLAEEIRWDIDSEKKILVVSTL